MQFPSFMFYHTLFCVCVRTMYVCIHLSVLAPVSSPCPSKHQLNYVTSHKGPCLTAAFSRDGKLAASGSADSSIKVGALYKSAI